MSHILDVLAGSSDTSGIVGYQVVAEESLEAESQEKSPSDHHTEIGGRVHVVGGDDLDPSEGHLEGEDGNHHNVIIAGTYVIGM